MGQIQNKYGKEFEAEMRKHLQELKGMGYLQMALFTGGFHGTPWDHSAYSPYVAYAIEDKSIDRSTGERFQFILLSDDEWSGLAAFRGIARISVVAVECRADETVWAFNFTKLYDMKNQGHRSIVINQENATWLGTTDSFGMLRFFNEYEKVYRGLKYE